MKVTKPMDRKVMSISISSVCRSRLEDVAIEENRSLSSVIETLIMQRFGIPKTRPTRWTKAQKVAAEMDFNQEEVSRIT
jgi:hypothetical protein